MNGTPWGAIPIFRLILAGGWVLIAPALLAWWAKGDLEMAWLIAIPLVLGGSAAVGLAAGLILRHGAATGMAVGAATALGALYLYIAMETPHVWTVEPSRGLVAATGMLARDTAALEAAAREATGLPVEILGATPEFLPGAIRKPGFALRLTRREPAASLFVSFAVGPSTPLRFDVVGWPGVTSLQVREPERAAAEAGLRLRAEAFGRRLRGYDQIEIGGSGPFRPGDPVLVRAARSETDWDLIAYRVAIEGEPLRETRRYSRDEIVAAIAARLQAMGFGRPREISIYFRPVEPPTVTFTLPEFLFFCSLDHPRYDRANVVATLRDGELAIDSVRVLTRPAGGRRQPGDRPGEGGRS
jgi:hypothetical protein